MRVLLLGAGTDLTIKCRSIDVDYSKATLTTLDINPEVKPHVVHDLNVLPYPFEDGQFDEIHAYEVLEHFGRQGDYQGFFDQFSELHRILKPQGRLVASVPRYDNLWAWGDPGHTRVINEGTLAFLDKDNYGKPPMTDYRGLYKGDFKTLQLQKTEGSLWFVLEKK